MKINMYDVGFGDCFLICDEKENLLVDFGSDNSRDDFSNISAHILDVSRSKDLSVLITHFHEDHISELLKQPLKAEKIYITDILAMNQTVSKLTFLQLNVLADIFHSISLNKKLKISLYDLLIKLCDDKSSVVFLSRGKEFLVSGKEYQVLWPSFADVTIHGRVLHRVIKALVTLGILPSSTIEEKEHFSDGGNENNQLLEKKGIVYSENKEMLYSEKQVELPIELGEIDKFIKVLVSGYQSITSNESIDFEEKKTQVQASYNNLLEFIEKQLNDTYVNKAPKEFWQQELSELSASMKRQANKCSLVFQDKAVENVSKMLMTGDITPSEFNKLLKGNVYPSIPLISKTYKVIKAPHHGTDTHFTNKLPHCELIMVSNGVTPYTKRHKIAYEYGAFYHSHRGSTIICSSDRCNLVDITNAENCKNCTAKKAFMKVIDL